VTTLQERRYTIDILF
jgi:hypothetical protein